MHFKPLAAFVAAILGGQSLSLGQGDTGWSSSSTPAYTPPPTTTYSSTPAYTPTPAPSASTGSPRTGLYGSVMQANAAKENTVDDFTRRPTLIGDQQYIAGYMGPIGSGADLNSAAYSIKGLGFNWFGSWTGRNDVVAPIVPAPDYLRFGLGNNTFGAGLLLSMAKTGTESPAGNTRQTFESDGYGLFGDMRLGSSDIYGELGLLTGFDNLDDFTDHYIKVDPAVGATATTTNNYFHFMGGWKKDATTEGTHAMNLELSANLSNKKDPAIPPDTVQILDLMLTYSHGVILKQATGFSVFAGLNSALLYRNENWNNPTPDGQAVILGIAPNVAFQKTLGKGFEVFSGAMMALAYLYDKTEPPGVAETTTWTLLSDAADVELGLRWSYENFAVEGSLSEALLIGGPNFISGTVGPMFAQAGVSVGF